jgi:proline dehydrogenase
MAPQTRPIRPIHGLLGAVGCMVMRRLLLWMAKNSWLRERLPKLWFAKRAIRRFMPGTDEGSALDAGVGFRAEGITSMYTRLGENVTRPEEADEVAAHYLGLLDDIRARDLDGEVSIKPTQLGFDFDVERTLAHAARLAGKSAETGKTLWIDMEGSAYCEGTIAFYERLKADHPNVGVCLQSYLRRSAADVQRLMPLDPQIRLVKGAYAEPASIAYQSRHDVDSNFAALAVALLEGIRSGRKVRLGLGTHDVRLIEQIAEHAKAMGLPKTSIEIQMLYGIRMDQQRRLAREGYPVRDLIAYGEAWYPWYMRRLAERPANVIFALRQMIG